MAHCICASVTSQPKDICTDQSVVFLTADETVVSFFESSAEDIETPMLTRLNTPETILRRAADASMVVQVKW